MVLGLGAQCLVLHEEPGDFGDALGVLITKRLALCAKVVRLLLERLVQLILASTEPALRFPVLHSAFLLSVRY